MHNIAVSSSISSAKLAASLCAGICAMLFGFSGCSKPEIGSSSEVDSKPIVRLSNSESMTLPTELETGYKFVAEPEYKSKPYYCKIAIGPNREKVFVTAADFTDQIVYVDLNSNGDLTEKGEWFELVEGSSFQETRFLSAVVPAVNQGEDTHTNLKIKFGKTGDQVKGVFSIMLWGWDESTTDADLVTLDLSTDAVSIPLLHFNGPLTMGTYRTETEMPRGKDFVFYSLVGTPGSNGVTLTAVANNQIPDDAHPMAEFEFPHRDSSQPAIKVRSFLNVRC